MTVPILCIQETMDFTTRLAISRSRIQEIYTSLQRRDMDMTERPHHLDWCFRVNFKNSPYSLSISVPVDMYEGFCETALILDGQLHYEIDWGYEDVLRFGSLDDLYDEIDRVARLVGAAV